MSLRRLTLGCFLTLAACGETTRVFDAGAEPPPEPADAGSTFVTEDAGTPVEDAGLTEPPDAGPPPVDGIVFVHGINGSASNWDVMVNRFKADGWPEDRLIANTYSDPRWGCNTANATQLSAWVQELKNRGATRIAVVAHSMGGLSSRYFLKTLGGTTDVAVFTSLGTMHQGLTSPCFSPLPVCVWRELCTSGTFLIDLNAAPATPGPTTWTSIFSDGDDTVPTSSSQLTGATNVLVPGLEHDGPTGLQDSEVVYQHVLESFR